MVDLGEIQYAKSGDVHIAYTTFGQPDGVDVVVTLAATWTIALMSGGSGPYDDLAERARVTVFDKRGTGASDPVARFTFEERIDDLRAVMDAAEIESAHLLGSSEGGPMSILFAATYPERVRSLTLYGAFPSWMRRADYPYGLDLTLGQYNAWVDRVMSAHAGNREDMRWFFEMWTPSMAQNPDFIDRMAQITAGVPPGVARTIWEAMYDVDVRSLLPTLTVPTTLVHQTGDRICPIEGAHYMVERIPGARLVEVPGIDHLNPRPIPEIAQAVVDHMDQEPRRAARGNRRFATVLFTDIVDSTPAVSRSGDRLWSEVLDRHDQVSDRLVSAHHGRVIKSTGDGMLAAFDGPSRAVECATELHRATAELGVEIRVGLHAGEIEQRGNDIAGIAVHVAARIAGLADRGQTLVSSTVKDLVAGSGFNFKDIGDQSLKGLDEPWRCYALE